MELRHSGRVAVVVAALMRLVALVAMAAVALAQLVLRVITPTEQPTRVAAVAVPAIVGVNQLPVLVGLGLSF